MNKSAVLVQKLEELKLKKADAEQRIKDINGEIDIKYGELAKAYQEFFLNKRNKEFVLYDRYPSLSALDVYISRISDKFPLYEYGSLDIKELAEMIKHIYQFRSGKEYNIFTMGAVETEGCPVYGGQSFSSIPHLYLMIGNDKTLAPYLEYNGKFVNSDKLYSTIYLNAKGQNMVCIEAKENSEHSLGMECLTGHIFDHSEVINYFNECYKEYMTFEPSSKKQIFSSSLRASLNYSGGYKKKGIKDVFDFKIHPFDTYIANILISTIIYKKNNNILDLSVEDYNHIFDVLYGERVNIIKDSERDIARKLTYVPNEKSGR